MTHVLRPFICAFFRQCGDAFLGQGSDAFKGVALFCFQRFLYLATLLCIAPVSHAQPAVYVIDPSHTFVTFEAKHMGASTSRGRWDKKEGQITFDKSAKTGRAEITLEMASISTGVNPFDGRLKSEDFFDVAKFPTAKFVGTQFKFDGDKVVEVSGELTLLGKTNPITLKAMSAFTCYINTRIQREVCGGDFDTTIQRSLWGMNNGLATNTIPDNIRLVIQIEAIKTQ
jgi:polyisoprenoid-binding protein YceI